MVYIVVHPISNMPKVRVRKVIEPKVREIKKAEPFSEEVKKSDVSETYTEHSLEEIANIEIVPAGKTSALPVSLLPQEQEQAISEVPVRSAAKKGKESSAGRGLAQGEFSVYDIQRQQEESRQYGTRQYQSGSQKAAHALATQTSSFSEPPLVRAQQQQGAFGNVLAEQVRAANESREREYYHGQVREEDVHVKRRMPWERR